MGIGALTKHHRKHPHHQHTLSQTHTRTNDQNAEKKSQNDGHAASFQMRFSLPIQCKQNRVEVRTKVAKTLKEENSTGNICFWPLFIRAFIWHVRFFFSYSLCSSSLFIFDYFPCGYPCNGEPERAPKPERERGGETK